MTCNIFQQEQKCLSSKNTVSNLKRLTCGPSSWILKGSCAGDHLDRVVLPPEGRWGDRSLRPLDVWRWSLQPVDECYECCFVPNFFCLKNNSFLALVGDSIEKPRICYNTWAKKGIVKWCYFGPECDGLASFITISNFLIVSLGCGQIWG